MFAKLHHPLGMIQKSTKKHNENECKIVTFTFEMDQG